MDEATAVRVREPDVHLVALDRTQGVQEIIDVESHLHFLTLVRTLHLILGFLLLRIVRLEGQQVRSGRESDSAVLLVGKDGGPLKRLSQGLPARLDRAGRIRRNYPSILRETTIYQLRSEANFADLGANVISADRELNSVLGPQDALQLEHPFAGHDDL